MYPVFFHLPLVNLPVFGFGAMVMLSLVAAILLSRARAKARGLDPAKTLDLCLYATVAGIAGARLAFLLFEYVPDLSKHPILSLFAIWEGGLTYQGGLLLGVATVWWFMHVRFWPAGRYLDVLAPAVLVGAGIGRIGCFLRGCCWGRMAHAQTGLSVTFPPESPASDMQRHLAEYNPPAWADRLETLGYAPGEALPLPVLPTQWFEVAGYISLGLALMGLEKVWRKQFDGALMLAGVILYSFFRFIIEFYRDDTPPLELWSGGPAWHQGQWFAVATLAAAAVAWVLMARRGRPAASAP